MEPEMVAFLRRVGKSIFLFLIWLAVNVTAAIKGDNAFIDDHVRVANVLFYIWFIVSTIILLRVLKKMWYKPV